jgi:serine protease Do
MSFPRLPDWVIYATAVAALVMVSLGRRENVEAPPAPPPPDAEEGALVGPSTPFDPLLVVEAPGGPLQATAGTAFAVSADGRWLTARHVVEGCKRAAILLGGGHAIPAYVNVSRRADVAVLTTEGGPVALPLALGRPLRRGQRAYHPGFPQGRPGEVASRLLGRETLRVMGRDAHDEPVLAWAEVGRTDEMHGSLAGLSGAPVLDDQGRVLGVTVAEKPRRGRIYTTAPESVRALLPAGAKAELAPGERITTENYGRIADGLRRELRVAEVTCLKT